MMENKKNLEQYLYQIEKNLSDLHPSDRAQVVLDINLHINESITKFQDKSLSNILEDLGSPQKVANHYRLDRGLITFKPKKHPIVKWLSISFLGSITLFFLFILILVWKFTPIFEIDEKKQRVVILGGLIDINGTSGKMKIMDQYTFVDNKFSNQFDGAIDIPQGESDELVINFKSGVLNITNSLERELSWNCKLETPPTGDFLDQSKDIIVIDLEQYEGVSCDISVPSELKLSIDGQDAQITVTDAEFDTFIDIKNGQVFFNENPEVDYNYDLKVKNGLVSPEYKSSTNPDAYETRIYIENGSIQKH